MFTLTDATGLRITLEEREPSPRPDTAPADLGRMFDLSDFSEPYTLATWSSPIPKITPPAPLNRAQRRAAEREERRRKKRGRLGLWWGIGHAVGRR